MAATAASASAAAAANKKRRILVVGSSGAGKSSLCKLMTDEKKIVIGGKAVGCTTKAAEWSTGDLTLIDTVGLNEGAKGTQPAKDAIKALWQVVRDSADGFSMLLFVRKCGDKISNNDDLNYKLFYEVICEKKVPMVLCFTFAEKLKDMDKWWNDTKADFVEEYKWAVTAAVSVCCMSESQLSEDDVEPEFIPVYRKKTAASKIKLAKCFADHGVPVVPVPPASWAAKFKATCHRVWRWLCRLFGSSAIDAEVEKLFKSAGFTPKEIDEIVPIKK